MNLQALATSLLAAVTLGGAIANGAGDFLLLVTSASRSGPPSAPSPSC